MKTLLVLALILAACGSKQNPAVCCTDAANCEAQGLTTEAMCTDGLICRGNTCVAEDCTTSADCEAGAPFCPSSGLCAMTCDADAECPGFGGAATNVYCEMGACVECRDATDCGVDKPVCSNGACRGCQADDECASQICSAGGTCAVADEIVYLDPAGVDGGQCTAVAPCKTLKFGLSLVSATRQLVSMHSGAYTESPAQLLALNTSATLVDIHGHNSQISVSYGDNYNYQFTISATLRDLSINAPNGGGAILFLTSQSAAFELDNVELSGAPGNVMGASAAVGSAISLKGGLTAQNVRIHDAGTGIADEGALTADGLVIHDTNHAIVVGQLQQANLQAKNALLYDAQDTALLIQNGIGSFSFSTIASTISAAGTQAAAADCNNSGVAISSSILWSPGTHPVQVNCNTTTSISGPPGPDPQFVNFAAKDFHLAVGSPAIDQAVTGPAYDFEGDARPQGAKFDYGADEYKP